MTRVKLCGMTRREDVAAAVEAGADYVGVIFAGGPREITVDRALEVLEPAHGRARAIGVFADQAPETITAMAHAAGLDGVQLHADPDAGAVERLRAHYDGIIWAALRVAGTTLGPAAAPLFAAADGVVLDARADGALGGTGTTLDWSGLALALMRVRSAGALLVLAGGLTPANVGAAVQLIVPDVVDVSSGIERGPGIKDHEKMRAFVDAARAAAISSRG